MAETALKGVRVLDLSEDIAGPYCTRLLGSYGAEVIKVERPGVGDESRRAGPFPNDIPHQERSALFLHLNCNKIGITLNLDNAVGRKVLKDLAKTADILVESFKPGQMAAWGLDYETLEKINPRLIMTSVTPFGQSGPYRDYKSSSVVLDALGGHMQVQGNPAREPLRSYEGVVGYCSAVFTAIATMGALTYCADTGQGQHIDQAVFDWLPGLDYLRTGQWTHSGTVRERSERYLGGWPGRVYRCRDGYVGLAVSGGSMVTMYSMMDVPELLDPKYETPEQRKELADELDALIQPWLMQHDRFEIFHALQELRTTSAVCCSVEDLLQNPQYEARGFWQEVEHPEAGRLKYTGPWALFSETEWRTTRPPLLGEHNELIYGKELGYSPEELTRLLQNGVI